MIEVTRRIEFDAAHRVIGHKFKCRYLHGHRYVLEVTFASDVLDESGMVIDFGEIKNTVKHWIDEYLDHNTILHIADKNLGDYISQSTGQNIYYIDSNPTAENIALHLKNVILPKLFPSMIMLKKVRLYETPNCYVEV
jgi:6-pyruvoyltetrahydropterin/6-carboxytetrahydropterin synthase